MEGIGLPIGWNEANRPDGAAGWVSRIFGWSTTVLAVLLGAPFWFDVLGKFARLRATGNREGTGKDNDRAPEHRDDPSARRRPVLT